MNLKMGDQLKVKALEDQLDLLETLEETRLKNYGIESYVPNKMQYMAHLSNARTVLYCGGNRAGKSTLGAVELTFHLTKMYPRWYPPHKRFKGPIKAAISATEYPIVRRVIEPKVVQYMPRGYYKISRNREYMGHIKCEDGSTVDVLTLEMKDEAYESADWDFVWCDEPQTQFKFQAMQRGLVDRMGKMLITFTPLTEPWMKDELVDKADGKLIDVFTVNIRDNLFDMNGNPILKEQAINEFEEKLPEEVKETRISGQFFHLKGAVYKEFGEEHLKDFTYKKLNKHRLPVICVLDPHDRVPHHVIWAVVDTDDDIWVDEEMEIHCELSVLAQKILEVEKLKGYKMAKRLIDPNFGRKPAASGSVRSVMEELARNKCSFYEANDDIELGHMTVREYLHFNRSKPVTAINKPKIFFSKFRCTETIKSVRNLQYEEWAGNTKSNKDPREKQKDLKDHGADCIRYLCMSRPRHKFMRLKTFDGDTDAY